jgi:hypothetical protein
LRRNFFIKAPQGDFELCEQHDGFNSETYRLNFASYLFTHLRGFRELMNVLLLDPRFDSLDKVQAYVRAEVLSVKSLIPDDWRKALSKNGEWKCHGGQIDRICSGAPARLDRNLQAVLALGIVFSESKNAILRDINIYEYVRLVPAVYALKNLHPSEKLWLTGKSKSEADRSAFEKLVTDLCPKNDDAPGDPAARARRFLADASNGHAITWDNARLIRSAISVEWHGSQVLALNSRMEGGRRSKDTKGTKMRCCDGEAEFIRLDPKKLGKLHRLSTGIRKAQAG